MHWRVEKVDDARLYRQIYVMTRVLFKTHVCNIELIVKGGIEIQL